MNILSTSTAAATAVVEYDLLVNETEFTTSSAPRTIKGISVTGSAAPGDTKVNLTIGGKVEAKLYNTATGFCTGLTSIIPCDIYVPVGAVIQAVITDAPATNPINLVIITQ